MWEWQVILYFHCCVLNLGHQAELQARLPAEPPFHIPSSLFPRAMTKVLAAESGKPFSGDLGR